MVLASQVTLVLQFISLQNKKHVEILLTAVQRKTARFLFLDVWVGPPTTHSLVVTTECVREESKHGTDCEGLDHQAISQMKDQASGNSCPSSGVSKQNLRSDLVWL